MQIKLPPHYTSVLHTHLLQLCKVWFLRKKKKKLQCSSGGAAFPGNAYRNRLPGKGHQRGGGEGRQSPTDLRDHAQLLPPQVLGAAGCLFIVLPRPPTLRMSFKRARQPPTTPVPSGLFSEEAACKCSVAATEARFSNREWGGQPSRNRWAFLALRKAFIYFLFSSPPLWS